MNLGETLGIQNARLGDFFSPEAGQRRRKWLNETDEKATEALRYYLGPAAQPVEGALSLAEIMSDGADFQDFMTASKALPQSRDKWDAIGNMGTLATAGAAMMMPGVSARMLEGATDFGADALRFARDEEGAIYRGRLPSEPPGSLRERYEAGILEHGGSDVNRVKLTPERMATAREYYSRDFNPRIFASADEAQDFREMMAAPTSHMTDAKAFAEEAIRAGRDVKFKIPDGPRGSIYVRVDGRNYRFADHPQPIEAGEVVGGFSSRLGRRHYPADVSIDPNSGVSLRDVVRFAGGQSGAVGPRTAAETKAQEVLDLLGAGRAGEVTDEMLSAADDAYLFRNYDLPMDEASRMARADEMGFGVDAYHGGAGGYQSFDPDMADGNTYDTGTWLAGKPEISNLYAKGMFDDGASYPVRVNDKNFAEVNWQGENWGDGPFDAYLEYADGSGDDIADLSEDWHSWAQTNEAARAARSSGAPGVRITDVYDPGPNLFDHDLALKGRDNFIDASTAVFDPTNIRSRFARFDPRLRHLRNLSAAAAPAGLLGAILAGQEERPDPWRPRAD